MKKIYKAAVIGCGRIGIEEANYNKIIRPVTHAGGYKTNLRVQLAALVDVSEKRLKVAKKYFPSVPLFRSAEEMFKKIRPDIVSIATHLDSHAQLVKLAARFKTPAILCEKPIAESIEEAKEMIKICKKNKSLLFINHQRRFDPLLKKWREKIKKGLIGKIVQGNCHYYNGLFNNGTHNVDLFRFFLGDVDWVIAFTNKETSWKKEDKDVDALISFKNGARVIMQALPKNYGFANFCFYGEKGSFIIKQAGYKVEYRKLVKNKNFKNYYQLSEKAAEEGKMRSFMKPVIAQVVSCLDGEKKPKSTGEDALAALKILFALRKSAQLGGKIVKIS